MGRVEQHARMQARNQAMRDRVDGLLADLRHRTVALKDVQQRAIAVTGSATSRDGTVSVSVDAAGAVTEVWLSPDAFGRTTPEELGRTVTELARGAAADARARTESILAPLQAGIPDLSDIYPGAPSLQDLRPPKRTPSPATRPADDDLTDAPVLRDDR